MDEGKALEAGTNPNQPLCIRFRIGDRQLVVDLAKRTGLPTSVWIRKLALARAALILKGTRMKPLVDIGQTARGKGEQICIRFQPDEYERIKSAATAEFIDKLPSTWIRALIMAQIGAFNGGSHKAHSDVSKRSSQRVNERNGSTHPVSVVGKSKRKAS